MPKTSTSRSTFDKANIFYPTPPTPWRRFIRNPPLFVAQWLYTHQPPISSPPTATSPNSIPIKVVCISDTHNEKPEVPDGDILLHAGDFTQNGSFAEIQAQLDWLQTLPHEHKIVIAGNHELVLDSNFLNKATAKQLEYLEGHRRADLDWGHIVLLNDTSVSLNIQGRKVNIFGSPMTPKYGNWAFQYPQEQDVWRNKIPSGTDIVLTHGPPKGHLDMQGSGCPHLSCELWRVKPRLAVFGHIHHGRGQEDVSWDGVQKMYDTTAGCKGGLAVFEVGVLVWIWRWILWLALGKKRDAVSTLVNAAIVGDWGIAKGTAIEI